PRDALDLPGGEHPHALAPGELNAPGLRDHALRLHAPDRVLRDPEQLGDLAHQPVALLAQRIEAAAERVRVVAVEVPGQPHGAVARQDHERGPGTRTGTRSALSGSSARPTPRLSRPAGTGPQPFPG